MSFTDDYLELRKKKKKTSEKADIAPLFTNKTTAFFNEEDIAPVSTTTTKTTSKKDDDKPWYKKGAFEDGYDFGDVTKTILGIDEDSASLLDLTLTSAKRGYNTARYGEESFKALQGYDNESETYKKLLGSEEYQFTPGNGLASGVSGAFELVGQMARQFTHPRTLALTGSAAATAAVAGQVGPQVLVPEEIVSVPAAAVAGFGAGNAASALEIEGGLAYAEMLEAGIKEETAKKVALAVGTVNASLEALQVDELLDAFKVVNKDTTKSFAKRISKELLDRGIDVAKETAQEVVQEGVTIAGTQLASKVDKGEWVYSSEDVANRLVDTAKSSALSFGMMNIPATVSNTVSIAKEQNVASGLTENEKAVADKEYENRIAKEEQNGKKLTNKEKSKIYDVVLQDMDKGYISTDTIEEVLGGESYKTYKDTIDSEDSLKAEFDTLNKMKQGDMTGEQIDRRNELKQQLADLETNSQRNQLKSKLSEDVLSMVKGDRLAESYNERTRRTQAFEADLTQYDTKQQETIKKAVESGILNNTNRTHEFVDLLAKVSADKGVLFDFTNNEKLKESIFAVDGAIVNGYFDKSSGTIGVNIDSAKALNTVVGHEITHVLEGTEFYDTLKNTIVEYAKAKGDYQGRVDALNKLYKAEDVDSELVADLVGDYLFTDTDFINNLSTNHRNVFEKIYDEIKYLYKTATAGSKEARELERVKKAFEDAYRAETKNTADSGVKHSLDIKHSDGTVERLANARNLTSEQAVEYLYKAKSGELRRDTYVPVRKDTPQVLIGTLEQVNDHIENLSMVMNVDKAQRAMAVENTGAKTKKYGDNVRKHGLTPEEIVAVINNLDNPATVIYQTKRQDKQGNPLPNSVAVFVEYNVDGREGMAAVEFENPRNTDAIGKEFGETNYHTVITVFEPDIERNGMPFDYAEELLSDPNNYELEIKRRQADESATGEKHPNTSNELPSSAVNVAQKGENVKPQYSLSDSNGNQLSKEQQEYFKDSKMRDADGNLKVMYHGSQDAGFHIFDSNMSDDDTSFFFVDRNDVAASYSGTSETYEAKTIRTPEDMNNFLAEIGYEQYEAVEKDGKFELLENNEHVATKDTMQEIYEEFCWYEGVGEGDANYKVYLNLTNPLVVDAKGRNWNNVSREYSQEVAERYHSLTTEEKAALADLAGWEEYSVFRDEMLSVAKAESEGKLDGTSKNLASAYKKLGGANANLFDAFTIASDNFSEESIKEFSVKQMNTRDFAKRAKEQGYDGVIFNNIVDNGGYSNGSEGASTVAIAFDSNQIKSVANEKPTADPDIRYSLSEDSAGRKINESMTMQEAKRMIETAYKVNNIAEYYEGEYANAEDWLKKAGSDEIEMYIENDFDLQAKYINSNEDILNEEYRISDVLDAYLAGTLVGKAKAKPIRLDVSQSTKLNDSRFYSPKKIENAKTTYELALQKAVGKDANAINKARAEILLFAHNKGAAELLGITQAELNKKLRGWSNYSATARNVSEQINAGVAEENRWTGIENSAYISKAQVTNEDIERLVASVEGDSRGYERRYIARVMLAADTHIDYSGLKFKFATSQQVNADQKGNANRVLGFYDDTTRLVEVSYDKPNTVAHEMGHYIDAQWGRDLLGVDSSHLFLTRGINADMVRARYGEPGVQFLKNFNLFINSLSDVNTNYNSYYNDRGEIFARFFAKFVEWTDNLATGNKYYSYESTMYGDKFTQRQYVEFAKLLQEKALLDGSSIQLSLSAEGEAPTYNRNNVYGKDIALEEIAPAKTAQEVTEQNVPIAEDVAPVVKETDLFPDDLTPIEADADRIDSITDADAPPEVEAPYPGRKSDAPSDPFNDRDWYEVGNRKVKAYMYENPEVKSFFQNEALALMGELYDTTKGERWYNDELYYESGGEKGFDGVKRHTSASIEEMLDSWHMSYADIEKGLNAIIEDNGAENIAAAKKIEFMLNDRLLNGYKDFYSNGYIPPNQDYINLINEKQVNEYSKEAFDSLLAQGDELAPFSEENVVAAETLIEDIAPAYEAIRPQKSKEPKMARATPAEMARNTEAEQKTAKIVIGAEQTQKQKNAWKWAKEHIFRHGAVFEDLSLKTGNRELQARFDNIRRAESMAQSFIGKGKGEVSALVDVRKAIQQAGKTEEFNYYLYHLHNVDRMTLEERFENIPNKPVYGDTITAEDSRQSAYFLEAKNPEFKQYAEEIYGITTHLRNMLADNGVISKETADLWETMYPHYVPINRVGQEGLNVNVPLDTGKTGVNAPIKKATGGSSDIYDVFDTMAQRIEQTYKAIAKNRFGVELKNTLGTTIETAQTSVDEAIDNVDRHEELLQEGKNGKAPTFTVFENGEKVTFEITEEMYEAMKPSQFTGTIKALNKVGNIRRDILTTYSPSFMLTNPIKDIGDIIVNSQHPGRTYATIPQAIKEIVTKGNYYQERMGHGGEQDSYFDGQTKTFKKEKGMLGKIVGFPFEKVRAVNEVIEQVPRMAEYIASRKMGRSIDVSMLDAARVTTNFGAAGDFTNMLNRNGFTFLGASVEGFNQQVRNIREAKAEGLKGWGKLAAKYLVAGLPALLLNHSLWDDDEDYEELSDYVKQNYYVVAKFEDGTFVRIPKGRAVAVIQNAFEQMENLITGNDEVDLKTFGDLFLTNLAPNNPLDNNIVSPVVDVLTNEAWYGGDLVPTRLQDLPAAEQFDESTDSISKWLGENVGISPYKFNYLLDQYSGGIGDMILPMLTPKAESGDNSLAGNLLAPLKDKFTTDSVMNNQNISDFYDTVDELSVNAKASTATDEDILKNKYINSVSAEMGELYAQKREIQNSNLADDVKYSKVKELQKQIDVLAEEALNSYGDVSIYDNYATVADRQYRWYEPGEDSEAEAGWQKITDKQLEKQDNVTRSLGITPNEYWGNKEEYDYAYEYPDKYAVAKSVGGYEAYKNYSSELYDIKADKDSSGKSISGSRKEKVIDYVNNLDADYGEKIILFKSEYPADDTYNYDIIEYLNEREDISYEEMAAILKNLGFTVSSDGTISWD